MKLPRNLSGRAVVQILVKNLGYRVVHERGSHVVLVTDHPQHHRIAIPDHSSLRLGTLNAIVKAVADSKHLDKDEVTVLLSR